MSGASLRDLIGRLIEEGKAWATAEIAVVKAAATAWIAPARIAVPLAIGALFLVQAALTVLIAALGMALATWLGVAGGLAVAAVIGLVVAGILVAIAASRFSGVGK